MLEKEREREREGERERERVYVCVVAQVLPQLEQFEKVYLWLGSEATARQAASQFARETRPRPLPSGVVSWGQSTPHSSSCQCCVGVVRRQAQLF